MVLKLLTGRIRSTNARSLVEELGSKIFFFCKINKTVFVVQIEHFVHQKIRRVAFSGSYSIVFCARYDVL